MQRLEAVVIGAGQAGLVMSHLLAQRGIEHVVLERGRIAERWRSERWDSLVFQFPNWMLRLPGHAYRGDDPDGFMPRDGIVRFLEAYARQTRPPVRCGVRVTGLHQAPSGRLHVATDDGPLEALHVVVATGPYQRPALPALARALPRGVFQTSASAYVHPQQLPDGGVLVVGSGASGWQIADDLQRAGRRVWLSVGRHRRVPRRYRGHDFGWWQEHTGAADRVVDDALRALPAPLLTGVDGGRDADLRALARQGVTLLGSLGSAADGRLGFVADLQENLAQGDAGWREFTRSVDAHVARLGLSVPDAPAFEPAAAPCGAEATPSEIHLPSAGIRSVVWATGYRFDFGWITCAAFDAEGRPVQSRGRSPTPGLYFLGLPRQHRVKSAFLWGVADDAAHVAECIAGSR